jgi:hypothetical protein
MTGPLVSWTIPLNSVITIPLNSVITMLPLDSVITMLPMDQQPGARFMNIPKKMAQNKGMTEGYAQEARKSTTRTNEKNPWLKPSLPA